MNASHRIDAFTIPIPLPALGQGMKEAVLLDLPKPAGSWIRQGEELALVESDKATHSIESPVDGTIARFFVTRGSRIAVGCPICEIVTTSPPEGMPPSGVSTSGNQGAYHIRRATPEDFPAIYDIWHNNQNIASVKGGAVDRDTCYPFLQHLIDSTTHPFSVSVACEHDSVVGWTGLFSCKNSPISHNWVAEMSLYVVDPDAKVSPAVLLRRHAIDLARASGLRVLLGYTNQHNHRAATLLKAGGFRCLGSVGRDQTHLWCYDC